MSPFNVLERVNMINTKLVNEFSKLIGNIEIAMSLDSFSDIKDEYQSILEELIRWVKNYYLNKNFSIVTYEKSLEIHTRLEELKWQKITDKNIGIEAMITDKILILYESVIKKINDERGVINVKR